MANRSYSRSAATPLAVAAATAALSETAQATTVNEAADFGNSFATETLLPIGTDVVNGNVFQSEGDFSDWVSFQGLLPGDHFDLTTTNTGNDSGNVFQLFWFDDVGVFLGNAGGTGAALSGEIPASGNLHFTMFVDGGFDDVFYTLTLDAPEPATAALLGGGLLAAAVLRRVRGRDGS